MVDIHPLEAPCERLFAGVSVGRRSGRVKAALLEGNGQGWALKLHSISAVTSFTNNERAELVAEDLAQLIANLASRAKVSLEDIEVLGAHDAPNDWKNGASFAAHLAEATGITVISDFAARDLAAGGRGFPLAPIPDWVLFHSTKERRVLLHFGAALRITYLEPYPEPYQVISFDAGPGCQFLDLLVQRLSNGKHKFDTGGQFAVQGRANETLINHWMSHPFFLKARPRFVAPGDFDESFLQNSLTLAHELRISARDLLCSANHWIIRGILDACDRAAIPLHHADKIITTGGGTANGLLWKLLCEALPNRSLQRSDELNAPAEAIRPIHAAIMAYCVAEQLPNVLPTLTGANFARVLGQITPGSADSWDRFVCRVADCFEIARSTVRQAA